MKRKEWKRRAKNAEARASAIVVSITCENIDGLIFSQVVPRGTNCQIPISVITPIGLVASQLTVSVS